MTERGTQNVPRKLADAVRRWEDAQPWRYSLDPVIAGHVPEVVVDNLDGDADFPPFVRDDVVVGAWWWDTHSHEERRRALYEAVRRAQSPVTGSAHRPGARRG